MKKRNFVLLFAGMAMVAAMFITSCGKDQYKSKYEQEKTKVENLQNQLSQKNTELQNLQSQIGEAQSRANAAEAAKADLESQVATLQGQITDLQNQIANAPSPGEVAALEAQLAEAQADLAAANQQIANLNNQITALNQQIVNLQAELLAAQQAAGPLQFETMGASISGTMRANVVFWRDLGQQVKEVEIVSYRYGYYPNNGTGNLEKKDIVSSKFSLYRMYDFDPIGAYAKGRIFSLSAPIPADLLDPSNDLYSVIFEFKYKLDGQWYESTVRHNLIKGIGGFWNSQIGPLQRTISPESTIEIPQSVVEYNSLWSSQLEALQ